MMKLVPSWFAPERTASIVAVLSLSYVFGGVAATLLAREVVAAGGGWRALFLVPALVLSAIAIGCALWVRSGPRAPSPSPRDDSQAARPRLKLLALFGRRQFLVVCALSFTLTLMRETFNTWSVDFLLAARTGRAALAAAALQSIAFDVAGAASILVMGLLYDRLSPVARRRLIVGVLLTLSIVLYLLPAAQARGGLLVVALIAATGLLVYGPYSLLAGALAVESGGAELAGAASGIIDAIGYAAGILSGGMMGRLLDAGGYRLGLHCLAGLTAVSAAIALGLGKSERVVASP
jgi:sugar phosphate permease